MGELHIPIIDEDALDELVTAVQALAAPSATNVTVDATSMDIITATNAQGALKQLDSAVDSVNSSLTQLENLSKYSTSETEIGEWIDGSKIYRRVWDFDENPIVCPAGSWVNTGISTNNIALIVNFQCLSPTKVNYHYFAITADQSEIQLLQVRSGTNQNVKILVLDYVKEV